MALGIFICRPAWSLGKVKSAVDVLSDICQACLLHLTKAAVSRLNSFSGQIITGPEKAKGENDAVTANARGAVVERGSFACLFHYTQSHHISHLQCKDFIVPTS